MIIKNYTGSGSNIIDEEFTQEELISISESPITSKLRNASNNTVTYYQNDEPEYAPSLDELRVIKKAAIQQRTDELTNSTCSYQDKTWGIDKDDKIKWLGLAQRPLDRFPITLVSKEGQLMTLNTPDEAKLFLDALSDYVADIEIAGGLLKLACNNAQTEEELNAITDTR